MDRERRTTNFLNIGHFLDHLAMLIFPTALIAMSAELGVDYGDRLLLMIGGVVLFGAAALPAGWLGDRWSRHALMAIFFFGLGAATILTGFAQARWQIIGGLALIGLFGAIYHPVGIAMLVAGHDKVGKRLGVNGVWGNMGVASAALLTGALVDWLSWRWAFWLPGICILAIGIAFVMLVPHEGNKAKAAPKQAAPLPDWVVRRAFIVLAVATFCGGVIFQSMTTAMPKILEERLTALGGDMAGIGSLAALVFVFAAIAQLIVGHVLDRGSLKWVFLAVAAAQPLLFLVAGSIEGWAMLAVAMALMFAVFGQIPINDAMVARFAADRWRARIFAVRYLVSFSSGALAVPLIAWTHDEAGGFALTFAALCALAVPTLLGALAMPADRASAPQAVPAE